MIKLFTRARCVNQNTSLLIYKQLFTGFDLKIEKSLWVDLLGKLNYNQKIVDTIESRQGELVAQFKCIVVFVLIAPRPISPIEPRVFAPWRDCCICFTGPGTCIPMPRGSACFRFTFFYALFADKKPWFSLFFRRIRK